MSTLPTGAIIEAVYDRLSAELSQNVGYAGSVTEAPYVAIEIVDGIPRDTKTTEGYTTTLQLRCHTEHDRGQGRPLEATALAEAADTALDSAPLGLGTGHANLHLTNPDVTPSPYEMGEGRDAFDIILSYDLLTQYTP